MVPLETYRDEDSVSPEDEVLQKEKLERAKSALSRLPQLQREAIVLTRYCGMKCNEVADILKTTHGSVRTAVYKGMKSLEISLQEDG